LILVEQEHDRTSAPVKALISYSICFSPTMMI
jgi:hypothetical protein